MIDHTWIGRGRKGGEGGRELIGTKEEGKEGEGGREGGREEEEREGGG